MGRLPDPATPFAGDLIFDATSGLRFRCPLPLTPFSVLAGEGAPY